MILCVKDNDENGTVIAQSEQSTTELVTIETKDKPKDEFNKDENTETKESNTTVDANDEKESPKIEEGVVLRKKVSE